MARHILTFDVEDNFTKTELADPTQWEVYEDQVVENTLRILRILGPSGTHATFFVVGKVAERHPELVTAISEEGHEIASHSYSHRPMKQMGVAEIEFEVSASGEILRDLSKSEVVGFRAMGFSPPNDEAHFLECLTRNGFRYDASLKYPTEPASNHPGTGQGGFARVSPTSIWTPMGRVVLSGGIFFRILPFSILMSAYSRVAAPDSPLAFYFHPWEFNRDQPRRLVPLQQRISQSPVFYSTERKLIRLLRSLSLGSIREVLET